MTGLPDHGDAPGTVGRRALALPPSGDIGLSAPSPRHRGRARAAPWVLVALAGCVAPPPVPAANMHIVMDVSGRVTQDGLTLSHPGDERHVCLRPARLWLASASGPAPPPEAPPNHIQGYAVQFGPDFPATSGSAEGPWSAYGPQALLSLEVYPRPGQLTGTGPVQLGHAFRITIGAGGRLWERIVEEDDPAASASVSIAADGASGRFHATGLVQRIPHNIMPESEAVSVTGRWRCPAP